MIKLAKHIKYCTIPIHFLEDENLSLEAKGLLSLLFAKNYSDFDSILNDTLTKEKLSKVLSELSNLGYLVQDGNTYSISYKSSKSKQGDDIAAETIKTKEELEQTGEVTKKLNLYEKCMNAIEEFTVNEDLRNILRQYLDIRLNPSKGSRLEDKRIAHVNQWKAQLNTLNQLSGNKIDIVKQSITNAWAKFVDVKSNSVEHAPVLSDRYTKEEIEKIKERAKSLDKEIF